MPAAWETVQAVPGAAAALCLAARGWTQDLAYQTVGRLSRMNPGMIDYDGPEADRQALAAWLAVVGSEGGP